MIRTIFEYLGIYHFSLQLYFKLKNGRDRFLAFVIYPFFSINQTLAKTYFTFFSRKFGYEQQLFLKSKSEYIQSQYRATSNTFLLRRNIHRIEKGLLTKPVKPTFALDYINQTVDLLINYIKFNNSDIALIKWGTDVLTAYFNVVQSHPTIDRAFEKFKVLSVIDSEDLMIPFKVKDIINNSNNFDDIVLKRKSIRYFIPDKIPSQQEIDKAVFLATQAPSSCNRQPYAYYIITDKEKSKLVAEMAGGAKTFAHSIPMMVAVVGQYNVSPSIGDRHLPYLDGGLSSMIFMLALENQGIATCALNWPENKIQDKKIAKLLGLQPFERPIMLIAVGYADQEGEVAFSARKSLDSVRYII